LNRNAAQDLISVLAGVVLVVSGCQRTQGLSARVKRAPLPRKPTSMASHWSTTAGSSKPISSTLAIPSTKVHGTRSTTPRASTPPKTKRYRPQTLTRRDFQGYFEPEADSPKLLEIVER